MNRHLRVYRKKLSLRFASGWACSKELASNSIEIHRKHTKRSLLEKKETKSMMNLPSVVCSQALWIGPLRPSVLEAMLNHSLHQRRCSKVVNAID